MDRYTVHVDWWVDIYTHKTVGSTKPFEMKSTSISGVLVLKVRFNIIQTYAEQNYKTIEEYMFYIAYTWTRKHETTLIHVRIHCTNHEHRTKIHEIKWYTVKHITSGAHTASQIYIK